MALADSGNHVAVSVEMLGDAVVAQVVRVLGERLSDHCGVGASGELNGEVAYATRRADDQDGVSLGERECIDRRERGDACVALRLRCARRRLHAARA
jgi:hypothetical protein